MNDATTWLFDLDGTLVDTAPDLVGAVNDMREDRGLKRLPEVQLRGESSNGARGLLRAAMNIDVDHADFAALRAEFLQRYADREHRKTRLFAGIEDLLQTLDATGRAWGIVTNKPIALTRPLLEVLDIKPQTVLGGDSAARPKPHPESLWLACAHLGVRASRCLYLGDAPRDIDAGNAAGMHTIACGWGYVEFEADPSTWGANLYAREVADLHRLLP